VKRLVTNVRELAKHGPMKPQAERGLSESEVDALGSSSSSAAGSSSRPGADPLGNRVGQPPSAQLQGTLNECAAAADESVSNAHAKLRRPLVASRISECLQNLKGAVMMAYPGGLPEWDPVRQGLEDEEDLSGTEESKWVLDPASAVLWFAGKPLERDQRMDKYTGKNEKVTLKARIEPKGGQAPQREPAVDEETRRAMMALHRKRELEQKALEEADRDSYLHSEWANPKGFKQAAMGIGNIRAFPGQR